MTRRRPAVMTGAAAVIVVVALWVLIQSPLVSLVAVAVAATCTALVASGRERSAAGMLAFALGLVCLAVVIAYATAIGLCQADVYCLFN